MACPKKNDQSPGVAAKTAPLKLPTPCFQCSDSIEPTLLRARDEWEWIDKVPKVGLFKEASNRERKLTPEEAKCLL